VIKSREWPIHFHDNKYCVLRSHLSSSSSTAVLSKLRQLVMLRPQNVGLARKALLQALIGGTLCLMLTACGGGGGTTSTPDSGQKPDPVVVDLPIAYIKRPIPVDEDGAPVFPELLDPMAFNPGAAIYLKDRATALATPVNITAAAFAEGALYDVKDLSVSSDGKKLLFSMHPPLLEDVTPANQTKWQIWEYTLATKVLRPIITSSIVAQQGDDLSPRYLPDGRILFSSTRQVRSKAILLDDGGGKPQFLALEEGGNETAFVLHTMKDDGTDIQQITYNQSHDLQPTVLQNGKVLYTHWDQFATNKLSFYTANPDGTQVERHYGYFSMNIAPAANTPRTRLFRPQEMPDGRIVAILKPDGALLGGDMVAIDTKHFFENDLQIPAGGGTGATAQNPISILPININVGANEFSQHGRYSALTPLYDGTNRLLVSWSECRLREPAANRLVPCTPTWLTTAGITEASPIYGIWVYNITAQTQQPVVLAEEGQMFTEPVSIEPRAPATYLPPKIDADLAAKSLGAIHIRSVYDMDGTFNNYGVNAFTSIEQIAQAEPDSRPARFVRLIKAVSIPDDETADDLGDNTYGNLFNQLSGLREILGYAPVEPDGSVKVKVPADVAFTLEVLDKDGKRIGALHRNWLQVRPGEVRECSGCHNAVNVNAGHGRSDAELPSINKGAISSAQFPGTLRVDSLGAPMDVTMGETMAELAYRSYFQSLVGGRLENVQRKPSVDLVFDDEWTAEPTSKAPSFDYRYSKLAPGDDDFAPTSASCMEADGWTNLCRVIINYENHIQPLWERPRPGVNGLADGTCVGCHTSTEAGGNPRSKIPGGQLELLGTKGANNQQMLSYTELTDTNQKEILVDKQLNPNIPVCELAPADLYEDIPQCVIVLDTNGLPTCNGVAECPFEQDPNTEVVLLDMGNPIPRTENIEVPVSMNRGSARGSARFFNRFKFFSLEWDETKPYLKGDTVFFKAANAETGDIFVALKDNTNISVLNAPATWQRMSAGAAPDTVDHRGLLNTSELKLLAEWLDIGGRYYNNAFDTIRP
jgi:hypothetical protein